MNFSEIINFYNKTKITNKPNERNIKQLNFVGFSMRIIIIYVETDLS